jgi:hypothetical protein
MVTRVVAFLLSLACLSGGLVAAHADASARGADGPTYDELPVGAATTLPWWQRGRLHLGATTIETERSDIVSRNGTTVVAISEDRRLGGPAMWYLVDGDRLERLPMETRAHQPLVSADGRWLAWKEVRAERTDAYRRIERYRVVYDVEQQAVANSFRDRRLVGWEDGINGIWLRTLSNRGRLVLHQGSDGVKVLSRRGRPARFGGPHVDLGNEPDDGWPRGTTIYRWRSGTSEYGRVARNGSYEQVGSFTVSTVGLWSATGAGYAYTDYDTEDPTQWVRSLDGETVQLDVPIDVTDFRIVGWESADAVILWHFDNYGETRASQLVRCATSTGACERVPDGPKAGRRATMSSPY